METPSLWGRAAALAAAVLVSLATVWLIAGYAYPAEPVVLMAASHGR